MEYKALTNVYDLHPLKRRSPRSWDLTLYRGCEHGCKYCYAIYFNDYNNDGCFFDAVYYYKDILKEIEKVLASPKWKRDIVNIGNITDCYQPIEAQTGFMREVLKLMIKYRTPVIITTQSDLILRDLDLLKQLAEITYVNVSFVITTLDESIRQFLEPNSCKTIDRLRALEQLQNQGITTGIYLTPIIPYVTDAYDNLNAIYDYAKRIGIDYIVPGILYLRGKTKPYFMQQIRQYDNQAFEQLNRLYEESNVNKEYKNKIYTRISELKRKYNISSDPIQGIREKLKNI